MISNSKSRNRFLFVVALLLGGALGVGVDRAVGAQQGGVKRTMLMRTDEPGSTTHEAVMGIAEIAPGASAGRHRHPGVEIGYVLEGSMILMHEGHADLSLKPGDTFKNDGVHDAKNTGDKPVKILAVYLVEKGKPLAEPVP